MVVASSKNALGALVGVDVGGCRGCRSRPCKKEWLGSRDSHNTTRETTRLVKQMESGRPGETRAEICEEKFFVSFFFLYFR